jgi:hypothetical protein
MSDLPQKLKDRAKILAARMSKPQGALGPKGPEESAQDYFRRSARLLFGGRWREKDYDRRERVYLVCKTVEVFSDDNDVDPLTAGIFPSRQQTVVKVATPPGPTTQSVSRGEFDDLKDDVEATIKLIAAKI